MSRSVGLAVFRGGLSAESVKFEDGECYYEAAVEQWVCTACDWSCDLRKDAAKHVRTHVRPYRCIYCSMRFATSRDVRRHQGAHLGGVPGFGCVCCGSKFTRKDNLVKHVRVQHG